MKTLSAWADLMLRVGRANPPDCPYKAAVFHGKYSLARDRLATLARADRIHKHAGGRCKGYDRGVATSVKKEPSEIWVWPPVSKIPKNPPRLVDDLQGCVCISVH